ncbi:hypothetical protein V6N12_038270 [Hibiscus sabdariffa]|uniref:Uncharacterized protein n=1 Tax=Hibiscus sabdariffa TaxID=183260 RepID=A0ABR1ZX84_9ROSI
MSISGLVRGMSIITIKIIRLVLPGLKLLVNTFAERNLMVRYPGVVESPAPRGVPLFPAKKVVCGLQANVCVSRGSCNLQAMGKGNTAQQLAKPPQASWKSIPIPREVELSSLKSQPHITLITFAKSN